MPTPSATIKTISGSVREAAGGAFWLAADRAFRLGLGFVVSVLVARHLGPARSGLLQSGLALAALLAALVDLGLEGIVRRELVRTPERSGELLGTAMILRLVVLVPAVAVFLLLFLSETPGATPWLAGLLAVTIAMPLALTPETWFLARGIIRKNVIAQNVAITLGALARGACALLGAGLTAFGATAAAETIMLGTGLWLVGRREGLTARRWRFSGPLARTLLRDAAPLLVTTFAITVYRRVDLVMITRLVGEAATGTYAVAVKLAETGYILPMILFNAGFPLLTQAHAEDRARYRITLNRFFHLVTWLGLVFGLALTWAAPRIVTLIYGARFDGAAAPLAIYAWTAVLIGQGIVRSQWLLLENLQWHGLWFALSGAVTNVVLNSVLIPRYGTPGAAIACLASLAVSLYVTPAFFPRTRAVWRAGLGAFFLRPAPPGL